MAERVYKIAMLGNEGVGKTGGLNSLCIENRKTEIDTCRFYVNQALLVRFLCHRFIGEYDPTIEDCYRRTVIVDGEQVTLDILDTASRSSTSKLKEHFLSAGDGYIVIYSIADRKSYITVPRYKEMIEESRDPANQGPVPFLLIGNKTDLEEHRTVAKNEGQTLANKYEWLFGEASAADYDGVDKSFCDLIREIRARRRKVSPPEFPSHLMNNLRHSSCSDNDSQTDESATECKKKRAVKKKLSDSSIHYRRKLFGVWH